MAEITASMVKILREQTGVGMMECKKALQEADGDVKRAANLLREKGAAKAVKRAGRATKEGRIAAKLTADKRKGALVEVNIETDFAARNDRFNHLVEVAVDTALACGCESLECLLGNKPVGDDAETVQALVTDSIAVIGENMGINRVQSYKVKDNTDGLVHTYIHPPGKVGVLIQLDAENAAAASNAKTEELAHELCLQIAFSNPAGIDSSTIPASVIATEKEVYRNKAIKDGKPEAMLDKIVEGMLKAYFKDNCLVEQMYVKEDKTSITQLVERTSKEVGGKITVAAFSRFQLGEGADEEGDAE
jgi:elongation factor Ts